MILLDTNILIWWLTNSPRIGSTAQHLVEQAEQVYFSAASVFEIEIKKHKLFRMPEDVAGEFERNGFSELPITSKDVQQINKVSMAGHDPFDQLLLAQAMNRGLNFMTSDGKILERQFGFVLNATV